MGLIKILIAVLVSISTLIGFYILYTEITRTTKGIVYYKKLYKITLTEVFILCVIILLYTIMVGIP